MMILVTRPEDGFDYRHPRVRWGAPCEMFTTVDHSHTEFKRVGYVHVKGWSVKKISLYLFYRTFDIICGILFLI